MDREQAIQVCRRAVEMSKSDDVVACLTETRDARLIVVHDAVVHRGARVKSDPCLVSAGLASVRDGAVDQVKAQEDIGRRRTVGDRAAANNESLDVACGCAVGDRAVCFGLDARGVVLPGGNIADDTSDTQVQAIIHVV